MSRTATAVSHDPTSHDGPYLAYSQRSRRALLREASDREVLAAMAAGEESALDELIERKTGALLSAAQRIVGDAEEARDIVQVGFFRMWEKRESYDERWSPNTWIYRIVTNLAIDQLRSRRSRERQNEPLRLHYMDHADERNHRRASQLHEDEVMAIFHELAADLPEKQRMVFLLRELEGLPSKEVADLVGCRESTVRNHLFNARRTLREKLVERYPEYARAYGRGEEEER